MRIKGTLSYTRLLVPFLLFAGVQIFAQAAADSRMPAHGPASHKTAPRADVFVISDRTFLMKSIAEIAMSQSFKSQSGIVARPISLHESAQPSCASSIFSVGVAASFFCTKIECPAPPPGCFYQKPPLDQNGCPTGCGQLVCGPEI